jgi:formate hydrogenlyase subunit 3/multisubunit Na+/H+ antiporter MnhD subunit
VYDRVHHRNLNEFGGLFAKMPVYSGFAIGIFFAALGLPGLCGFIGEVFVVLSVWNYSTGLAVIAAAVVCGLTLCPIASATRYKGRGGKGRGRVMGGVRAKKKRRLPSGSRRSICRRLSRRLSRQRPSTSTATRAMPCWVMPMTAAAARDRSMMRPAT